MKTQRIARLIFLLAILPLSSLAQNELPKEYVAPEELVSLHSEIDLATALDLLSEYAIQFVKKPIYDPQRHTGPIGVDIRSLPWKKSLGLILSRRGLWYIEKERYIEVVTAAEMDANLAGKNVLQLDENINLRPNSREIKIETIFFEGDRNALREIGLDWSTFYRGQVDIDASQAGALEIPGQMFNLSVNFPKDMIGVDLDVLLKAFDSKKIGKVLAQPQVVVTEGKEGTIQVGQDFSIKERDFAGNVIDRFYSTGTILKVKPYIIQTTESENQKQEPIIFLNVHVERSTAHPDVVSTIINKSQANSFLQLFNGEETLIAGLYSTEKNTLRKGVPLLKDLPWWFLGFPYIFGYDRVEETEKELVIIIKASLLNTVYDRQSATKTDVMNLKQSLVQGAELQTKDPNFESLLTRNTQPKVKNTNLATANGPVEYHPASSPPNPVNTNQPMNHSGIKFLFGKIIRLQNQLALVIWNPESVDTSYDGKFVPIIRKDKLKQKVNIVGRAKILETRNNRTVAKISSSTNQPLVVNIGDFLLVKK